MKLAVPALSFTLALGFGCSANPDRMDTSVAEETTQEAPAEVVAEKPPEVPEQAPQPAPVLVGVEWSVENIADTPLIPDSKATLIFSEDGQINGNASCNSFFGTYQVTDMKLVITTAGMTRMACPDPVMNQEQLLMTTLGQVDAYHISSEGVLTLHTSDHVALTARQ